MSDVLYGGWGVAELIALIQKYPWPSFAIALTAGLLVYAVLHPERGDGASLDLGGGDSGDAGGCGD